MAKQKQTPTVESLQKDIKYLEWRVPMEQQMAVEYKRVRDEHDEGSIPAMSYERYAGADGNAKRFAEELEQKRKQLDDLLSSEKAA